MKELIEKLYPINAYLVGEGYDKRLDILKEESDLEILSVDSGFKLGPWVVPEEWVCKEAWIKKPNGEKLVDFVDDPFCVVVGSKPFNGKLSLDKLKKHITHSTDFGESSETATTYRMSYMYEDGWGFSLPWNKVRVKEEDGYKDILEEGEYEVFIDSEFKRSEMKIGVHTIPGKIDREILLFAHLDHPYQANDNLSSVACLVDLAKRIKSDRTIKMIFCPETIGSIAYAHLEDISKVDFVIALEACGTDNPIQVLKAFDKNNKLNHITHCALQIAGKTYKKGEFRANIGSDENIFNDPQLGIPGLCISRWPYKEYHTSDDKPEIIKEEMIKETGDLVQKIIEIWDKDYVPVKNFLGPIFRSKYGLQSPSKQVNLNYDYLFYTIDGKKSLAELAAHFELNFDALYDTFKKISEDGYISGPHPRKGSIESPFQ